MREIIKIEKVRHEYEDGRVTALREVSFAIGEGEYVAIVGPSGSGKSTLLHLLGALETPTSGRIEIDGQNLCEVRDLNDFRAKTIGFIFQSFHLLPTLTAEENVQIPMFERSWSQSERLTKAHLLLEQVGLGHRATHRPKQLSGGERQRVAIARSLANNPSLILADEPTGNLDSANALKMIELLENLHAKEKKTFIIVTHDPSIAARADRRLEILDGEIKNDIVKASAS